MRLPRPGLEILREMDQEDSASELLVPNSSSGPPPTVAMPDPTPRDLQTASPPPPTTVKACASAAPWEELAAVPCDAPAAGSDAPVGQSDTSVYPSKKPANHVGAFAEQYEARLGHNTAPADQSGVPTGLNDVPVHQSEAPLDHSKAPAHQFKATVDQSKAPTNQSKAPAHQFKVPALQSKAPTDHSDISLDQSEAPTDPVDISEDLCEDPEVDDDCSSSRSSSASNATHLGSEVHQDKLEMLRKETEAVQEVRKKKKARKTRPKHVVPIESDVDRLFPRDIPVVPRVKKLELTSLDDEP